MKLKKISKINAVGLAGTAALALLAVAMLCPAVTDQTSALDCPAEYNGQCTETYAAAEIGATVAPVISIAMENKMDLDITPKSSGLETQNAVNAVTVRTNNTSGYSLYIRGNGENPTELTYSAVTDTISSIDGENVALSANKWGYNLTKGSVDDVNTYTKITASDAPAGSSDTNVNIKDGDKYTLTIGVAVDTTLPAGTYTGSVILSAVANPIEIQDLNQLVYMQDMTSKICEKTAVDATKQLIDTRDGKKYWVAKLRDGNCWMTQNLALDLSTGRTLTSADTNVASSYTPKSNTDQIGFAGTSANTGQTNDYSWGKWKYTVLATPQFGRNCNSNRAGNGNNDGYNSIQSSESLAQTCSGEGFIDVSGSGWQPTYTAQVDNVKGIELTAGNSIDTAGSAAVPNTTEGDNGPLTYPYTYKGLIAVDLTAQTYDAHYLVGNYYQYSAATAGTNLSGAKMNATGSICPKGWTLPRSGNNGTDAPALTGNDKNGTFYNLLAAYGVQGTVSSTAGTNSIAQRNYSVTFSANQDINATGTDATKSYTVAKDEFNIAGAPLSFVRSGNVALYNGYLRAAGRNGYYWSRSGAAYTSTTSANAYYLGFDASGVNPSNLNFRYNGFSLRCLQE